ncbi:cyclin-domain-containing protein [Entophlyctis helioformis]|nr:cyclin-domain-containing protein [Entophlyctis helioformis]
MSSAPTPESSPTFDLRHTSATDTIRLLALFLSHASHANDALPRKPALTRFHARTIPSIDILGYLSRILKYAPCGPECFLAVLIYFERMCGNPDGSLLTPVDPVVDSAVPAHVGAASAATPATASDAVVDGSATAPASVSASGSTLASASASGSGSAAQETVDATQQHMRRQSSAAELISADSPLPPGKRLHIVINSYNVHRLLIAGSMIAVKFLSDVFYTNSHMAKVGGLPVQELNRLEIEFLLFNDFNLNVTTDELQASGDKLLAFALEHGAPLPVPYVAPPVAAPEPAAETEAAAASGQDHMVEAVAAPQPPAPTDPGAAGSETASHAANHSGPGAGSSPGSGTPPSHSHDAAHRHRIPSTSATPSVDAGAGADGDVVMSQALPSQPLAAALSLCSHAHACADRQRIPVWPHKPRRTPAAQRAARPQHGHTAGYGPGCGLASASALGRMAAAVAPMDGCRLLCRRAAWPRSPTFPPAAIGQETHARVDHRLCV